MTTRTVVVAERDSEIKCYAPHPLRAKVERFAGRDHGHTLSPPLPFVCVRTGRTWRRDDPAAPPRIPGRIYGECSCGWVSEYEVVAPPASSAA